MNLEKLNFSKDLNLTWNAPDNADEFHVGYYWRCYHSKYEPVFTVKQFKEREIKVLRPFKPGEVNCVVEAAYYKDSKKKRPIGLSAGVRSNSVSIPDPRKSITCHFVSACVLILWTKTLRVF